MERYNFTVEENPKSEDVEGLIGGLIAYNTSKAEPENYKRLAVFVRDNENRILGGILAHINWRWLFISQLWLADELRGKGYGQKLVAVVEQAAIAEGCRHAHVDTFSFQARGFYEKLGYKVFGVLEDYPKGHSRYYLQKRNLS